MPETVPSGTAGPEDGVETADDTPQVPFRALSYCFTVQAGPELASTVGYVLAGLRVPDERWAARSWPQEQHVERWVLGRDDEGNAYVRRGTELLYAAEEAGDVLDHFLWAVNQRVIERARDFFLVHAAVLSLPGQGAVLLPGEAGAGKSSLTVALARAGFGYLSDELAAIDPVTRRVHPYSKALTLKAGSYDLFPDLLAAAPPAPPGARQRHLTAADLGTALVTEPQSVRAVVFPQYSADAEGGLSWAVLSPGQAALRLARQGLSVELYGARSLPVLRDLALSATGAAMVHSDLDAAVTAVRSVLEAPGAP